MDIRYENIMSDWRDARIPSGVGKGWEPIVDDAWAKMQIVDPYVVADQVKEKFAGLRIYYSTKFEWESDERKSLDAIVRAAENEAAVTCEWCGSKENVTTESRKPKGYWIKTLCADCHDKWNEPSS